MADGGPDGGGDEWRIEELAARAGSSVDTIRFYQREGLLEPPRRQGRTAVYGAAHLRRLVQVRDLQARHLSLAAIRSLLESSRLQLAETLFAAGSGDYTRDQLAEESGVATDLIEELEGVGLLAVPQSLGRVSFDDADLRLLRSVHRLLELGLPRPVVVRLGAIYAGNLARMQEEVLQLFTDPGSAHGVEDLEAFQTLMADQVAAVLEPVQTLLDYSHFRAVQALTFRSLPSRVESRDRSTPP
ncbi:MAG: MerR family transcriptional regulator [Mycobacteriales bacterium]